MQNPSKQIETGAISAYCTLRAKGIMRSIAACITRIPLSTQARSSKARALRAASSAGLAELAAYEQFVPLPFSNEVAQTEQLLLDMHRARTYQLARELQIVEGMM